MRPCFKKTKPKNPKSIQTRAKQAIDNHTERRFLSLVKGIRRAAGLADRQIWKSWPLYYIFGPEDGQEDDLPILDLGGRCSSSPSFSRIRCQ